MIELTRAVQAIEHPAAAYAPAFLRHHAVPCFVSRSGKTLPIKPEACCSEVAEPSGQINIVQDKLADSAEAPRA